MQRHRFIRAVFAGAATAAAVAVAAVPAAGVAAPRHAHPAALRPCSTSGLVVWLSDTAGGGAAGSFYYTLELTNLSGSGCTLSGYPGVSAVNLSGAQVGSAATRTPGGSPTTVALANGSSVKVTLRIVDVLNFPTSSCRPTTAAGLRVYPPGQTASKVVPFPFKACSRTGTVYLNVGPVQ